MNTPFKNFLELNQLSYDDLINYRSQVLRSDTPDWRKYIDEFELYMDIRFKQKVLDKYQNWRTNPPHDPGMAKAINLILELKPNDEMLYDFFISGTKKLLQPYKYIDFYQIS